jgi:hypothetical protein
MQESLGLLNEVEMDLVAQVVKGQVDADQPAAQKERCVCPHCPPGNPKSYSDDKALKKHIKAKHNGS